MKTLPPVSRRVWVPTLGPALAIARDYPLLPVSRRRGPRIRFVAPQWFIATLYWHRPGSAIQTMLSADSLKLADVASADGSAHENLDLPSPITEGGVTRMGGDFFRLRALLRVAPGPQGHAPNSGGFLHQTYASKKCSRIEWDLQSSVRVL